MGKPSRGEDDLERVEQYGSLGEKQIARMLSRYNILFEYEKPVAVRDRGYVRLWYPDFWLPEVDVYVEYSGNCIGMDGRRHWKKVVYDEEGISCLWLQPHDLHGYWPKRVLEDVAQLVKLRNGRQESVAKWLKTRAESRESIVYAWRDERL